MNNTEWKENENPLDSINRLKNECLKKRFYEQEKPVIIGPKMAQWLKERYPEIVINKLEE